MLRMSQWAWVAWWAWAASAGAQARELDPAACGARFDVQRDKIIRTEESREMGARYLSELDVGSRRECLRLCCETDTCDVFVFEEKSPGSCYLFKCGPPEDFRCKFTAHGNFSSGVLALSRRLAELQDQEKLAPPPPPPQPMHELGVRPSSTSTARPAAHAHPLQPMQALQPLQPLQPLQQAPLPTGRCSRYQFECRVGGECIAVYNACDGIAQCADGSDEAPELGCPAPAAAAPPERPAAPAPAAPPAAPHTTHAPPIITRPPTTTHAPQPPVPQIRVASEVDENGVLSAAEAAADAVELWPHRLTQAQPQHRYNTGISNMGMSNLNNVNMGGGGAGTGSAPHIFSHKGGLVQELGDAYEPPDAWPRRAWQPPPHHPSLSVGMGSERMSLGMEGAEAEWGLGYPRAAWPDAEPRRAWPAHRLPPPQQLQEQEMYGNAIGNPNILSGGRESNVIAAKTMPELPLVYSGQQQALRDSPKKGFELSERPPPPPPPPAPPAVPAALAENATKKKVLKDTEIHETSVKTSAKAAVRELGAPSAESHGAAGAAADAGRGSGGGAPGAEAHGPAAAAHEWADEHDGLSDHPPAALLLLVLGTLMTAALGALAGCRVRAARRRRHHPRYALDADYLVNGMYL